jgi:general secretion pathway protein G
MKRLKTPSQIAVLAACLLALSISCADPRSQSCRISPVEAAQANIKLASEMYRLDCGVYPTNIMGLITNPGVTNWRGPYLDLKGAPTDPWGTPYSYCLVNGKPEINSAGPDRKFGTSDDNGAGVRPRTTGCTRF